MILRPILQPVLQPVLRSPFDRRPTALTVSQLLPSGAGRVAAIYSDPAKPSYDECIQKNMEALGPELVVNGGFDDGTANWSPGNGATITSVSGGIRVTQGATFGFAYQDIAVDANKTYVIRVSKVAASVVQNQDVAIGSSASSNAYGLANLAASSFPRVVSGLSAGLRVYLLAANIAMGEYKEFDNVSVREIDLSKCVLFSDAAGQTPVVYPIGAGQGKGLLLDRSAWLVRGPELVTNGGPFTDATGWGTSGAVSLSVVAQALRITATGLHSARVAVTVVPESWYEFVWTTSNNTFTTLKYSVYNVTAGTDIIAKTAYSVGTNRLFVKIPAGCTTAWFYASRDSDFSGSGAVDVTSFSVRELPGHHQQQPTAAARGEFSRRYNQLLATATLSTQSITAIATQYRLSFTGAGTVTLSGAATGTYSAGSHTITCTAGSLTLTVAGSVLTADLRFEADATIGLPEYQRVTTASDYDEVGFPTYWRAQTDDWAKSHMNPNGATKAYVFWAGQKMSDAATALLVESSVNSGANSGTLALFGPLTGGTGAVAFRSSGSLVSLGVASISAPSRLVVAAQAEITTDTNNLTVNGSTTTTPADQGTGTYTEQDVFFGARAGTSFFANIREYAPPLILFLQPADSLSASHLSKLQRSYAKAAGVTL